MHMLYVVIMSNLFQIIVCAAIQNSQNQTLLARRKADKKLGGFWEFPGGKLETGEDLSEALKREIREELNLEISNEKLLHIKPFVYPHGQVLILFYVCNLKSGSPQLVDHDEIRWCEIQEIKNFDLLPANEELVQALQKHQTH